MDEGLYKFAVILGRYKDKWIFCRHKERLTWEISGGRREAGESIMDTAKREFYEETGAGEFTITPVSPYYVERDGERSYGYLFFADVTKMGPLPDTEIAETGYFDNMPDSMTYPEIQPALFNRVGEFLKQ